ncbi:MAG: hypothetical protein HYY44_07880 [Deltaproteobacteria bacterium]|nr:hypothetical protein [Deltaproteobacteria bacterium]
MEPVIKEVTHEELKRSVGHPVEVIAFGICYQGRLTQFDSKLGTIRVVDKKKNYAVLEIERIEAFKRLDR